MESVLIVCTLMFCMFLPFVPILRDRRSFLAVDVGEEEARKIRCFQDVDRRYSNH